MICEISGSICVHVKPCLKTHKWVEKTSMDSCKILIQHIESQGSNKVRFEHEGFLYVENNGSVVKVKNPYNYTPDAVNLTQRKNKYYIKK